MFYCRYPMEQKIVLAAKETGYQRIMLRTSKRGNKYILIESNVVVKREAGFSKENSFEQKISFFLAKYLLKGVRKKRPSSNNNNNSSGSDNNNSGSNNNNSNCHLA